MFCDMCSILSHVFVLQEYRNVITIEGMDLLWNSLAWSLNKMSYVVLLGGYVAAQLLRSSDQKSLSYVGALSSSRPHVGNELCEEIENLSFNSLPL